MGEIIGTMIVFIMGAAVGFFWRDRISKARHAKARERRGQREGKWQTPKHAPFDVPPHWRSTIMGFLIRRRQ